MFRWAILILVGGCYLDHGLVDVDFSASASSLVTCNCHHGFGPGADGVVELRTDNQSGTTLELAIIEVRFERDDGTTISDRDQAGRGRDVVRPLPPGESVLDLSPYIDFVSDPASYAGTYRCRVDLELEGIPLTVDAGEVDAEYIEIPFG